MKLIKFLFVITLVNFLLLAGLVLAAKVLFETSTENTKKVIGRGEEKCIIVVDKVEYDVTLFKKIHPGGDVFDCGKDMSEVFHQQHNQKYLQIMEKYKLLTKK